MCPTVRNVWIRYRQPIGDLRRTGESLIFCRHSIATPSPLFHGEYGAKLFHRTGRLVLLLRGGPQNTTIQNKLAASADDDIS